MVLERIDAIHRACASRGDVLALAGGLPDASLFPRDALRRAAAAVMKDPRLCGLQYGWPEGDERLRTWIASRISAAPDDVIITAGAQQAIAIAARVLLGEGARMGVARETYAAALELFRSRGLAVVDEGPADALYAMPAIGNPTGLPMSAEELARAETILADDAYAELRFDGARSPPVAGADVFRIGTFAKTLCPGLRVGWLAPPPRFRARVLAEKRGADLETNHFGQAVLAELLRTLDWDAHVAKLRAVYARRADALATALRRALPSFRFREPAGGFSIWIETDASGDDVALLAAATSRGTSFDPGCLFRARPRDTIALRASFSNVRERDVGEAVRRLALGWNDFTAAGTCSSA